MLSFQQSRLFFGFRVASSSPPLWSSAVPAASAPCTKTKKQSSVRKNCHIQSDFIWRLERHSWKNYWRNEIKTYCLCIWTSYWPRLCTHGVLHDHVPVDAENTLAHLNLIFQEFGYILAWLQQEHIGWVGQEHLQTGTTQKMVTLDRVHTVKSCSFQSSRLVISSFKPASEHRTRPVVWAGRQPWCPCSAPLWESPDWWRCWKSRSSPSWMTVCDRDSPTSCKRQDRPINCCYMWRKTVNSLSVCAASFCSLYL